MESFYKKLHGYMYGENVAVAHAAKEMLASMPQEEIDAYTEWEERCEGEENVVKEQKDS